MSGFENLQRRLEYHGGIQEGRMIDAKDKTLKKALWYSYQACTAILKDGREFRCLINPDKLKTDYEDKIISIPFKDRRVGFTEPGESRQSVETSSSSQSDEEEEIGMKPGDVFEWKETNSYWLVYLQRIEEDAYFRAEIRRCRYEVDINNIKYKVHIAGPSKNVIAWHTKKELTSWNDMDYNLLMYITKDENTDKFLERFTVLKINGKTWEVQMVDRYSTEGVLEVKLKEYFEASPEPEPEPILPPEKPIDIGIIGENKVFPYDIQTYTIKGANGGRWKIGNDKAVVREQNETEVTIEITTGRSGETSLIYERDGQPDILLHIQIQSF